MRQTRAPSRKCRLGWVMLAVAGAAVGSAVMPALAQEAPAEAPGQLNLSLPEIDVQATAWRAWQHTPGYVPTLTTTGTKTDTPLIEAPQSVGVVTRDQMDDQSPLSVAQALRFTAGTLAEIRPSSRYDSVFVRGFGGQGSGAAYVNFLDGLRQGRGVAYMIPNTDPWLLERIEVLRGPASVLYGQTGAGGLVNLVSRRPTANPVNEIRLEAGSNARMQAMFDLGGRLNEDGTLLYRLTGVARTADTQYDYAREERVAIAPAVTWQPNDDTTLTILGNFQHDPEGGFYNFAPAYGTVLPNVHGRLGSNLNVGDPNWTMFRRTAAAIGYQFEHRIDNTWTVRQNFRYQYLDSEFRAVSPAGIQPDVRVINRRTVHSIEHGHNFALDNQAQASFRTGPLQHTLLFGLDWTRSWARSRLGQGTAPPLDLFAPAYHLPIAPIPMGLAQLTTQQTDQLGAYVQDQIGFGRWRLALGLRHDWATSETIQRLNSAHTSQTDAEFTWRAGLLYLFDNGFAPYASYSTSFLPNAGVMAPQRGGSPFQPTTGEQYEIGVKYQPPGSSILVQVAGFHIVQDNVLTPDPIYNTFSVQTGRIRSRGIEVEARASLTDNLDVIGTYTYLDTTIQRSNVPGVAGNRVPQVPRHMANLWANYRFAEGPLRGLELGGGVRYVGRTAGDDANSFSVPSVTLFDAAIRYDLGALSPDLNGLTTAVSVSNIADKEYVSSCSAAAYCYFGLRRTVLGSLSYRW